MKKAGNQALSPLTYCYTSSPRSAMRLKVFEGLRPFSCCGAVRDVLAGVTLSLYVWLLQRLAGGSAGFFGGG